TGARALEDCGFAYGRYSQVLEKILRENGITPSRETLQELGERVHREQGQRWLLQRLVVDLPTDQDLAIDGLRFPEDHAFHGRVVRARVYPCPRERCDGTSGSAIRPGRRNTRWLSAGNRASRRGRYSWSRTARARLPEQRRLKAPIP